LSNASLVIQTSFLGDVILTTPLIAELAKRGPVDIVATKAGAMLLANNPDVRRVIVYDKRGADSGPLGVWKLARKLKSNGYEFAYLAQGSHRSGILARLAGIPRRIGFDTSAGKFWYTYHVPHRGDRHHAERLLRLGLDRDATVAPESIRPRLYPDAAAKEAVDALLRDVPRDGATMLALAPGSIWGTKRWPHFPALAARLASVHRIVVLGAKEDARFAAEVAQAAGPARVVDATGKLSLLASAELISRCAAIVTNDSAPLHLASAMGTPTVAIFGPTVPAFGFGPLAPKRSVAEVSLDCRPCSSHGPQSCPLGHHNCMKQLTPGAVADLVLGL
jgi:heptosyltransferase-2